MSRIKIIIPFIIALLFVCADLTQGNAQEGKKYPKAQKYKLMKINEIKKNKIKAGLYNIEGYVVKIYTCPPCPPNVNCKPCMADNFVISDINKRIETYNLTDNHLIIFGKEVKQFKLGRKYLFSIKIKDEKSTNEPINDLELIGYTPL